MVKVILLIGILTTGTFDIEVASIQPTIEQCEEIKKHPALSESYPGRQFMCVELRDAKKVKK